MARTLTNNFMDAQGISVAEQRGQRRMVLVI